MMLVTIVILTYKIHVHVTDPYTNICLPQQHVYVCISYNIIVSAAIDTYLYIYYMYIASTHLYIVHIFSNLIHSLQGFLFTY